MPIPPLVAIVIPVQIAPDLAAATLQTCNLALGAGHCIAAASQERAPREVSWVARVALDGASDNSLTIELQAARGRSNPARTNAARSNPMRANAAHSNPARTNTTPSDDLRSSDVLASDAQDGAPHPSNPSYQRALRFESTDAPLQRWSTAGVVVAALVVSAESNEVAEAPGSSGSAPQSNTTVAAEKTNEANKTVAAPPKTKTGTLPTAATAGIGSDQTTQAVESPAVRLDLAGDFGPGIVGHRWRTGFHFRPQFEFDGVAAFLQLGGSWANDSIAAAWLSGAAGLGIRAMRLGQRFAIDARIAAVASRVTLTAVDFEGQRDSAARWRYGVGLGLDAVLQLGTAWGLFVAADGVMASPAIKIRVANSEVGEYPTAELLVGAGIRWRIPIGR